MVKAGKRLIKYAKYSSKSKSKSKKSFKTEDSNEIKIILSKKNKNKSQMLETANTFHSNKDISKSGGQEKEKVYNHLEDLENLNDKIKFAIQSQYTDYKTNIKAKFLCENRCFCNSTKRLIVEFKEKYEKLKKKGFEGFINDSRVTYESTENEQEKIQLK